MILGGKEGKGADDERARGMLPGEGDGDVGEESGCKLVARDRRRARVCNSCGVGLVGSTRSFDSTWEEEIAAEEGWGVWGGDSKPVAAVCSVLFEL